MKDGGEDGDGGRRAVLYFVSSLSCCCCLVFRPPEPVSFVDGWRRDQVGSYFGNRWVAIETGGLSGCRTHLLKLPVWAGV